MHLFPPNTSTKEKTAEKTAASSALDEASLSPSSSLRPSDTEMGCEDSVSQGKTSVSVTAALWSKYRAQKGRRELLESSSKLKGTLGSRVMEGERVYQNGIIFRIR